MEAAEFAQNLVKAMRQATDADCLVYDDDRCSICLHQYGPGDMICFFVPCLQHVHRVCHQNWHGPNYPNCNLPFIALAVYAIHLDLSYARNEPEDLNPMFNYPNQAAVAADEPNDQEPEAGEQWQMWLMYVFIFPFY